jgi:hypothetical protein
MRMRRYTGACTDGMQEQGARLDEWQAILKR